jgi:toxin ParE1/3/4
LAQFRFSRLAEADLLSIAAYTVRVWGEDQAVHYLSDLEGCCSTLAQNPELGRRCEEIRPGLRRMQCGRHVIFHRPIPEGIAVSRILHQRMLPGLQPIEDEDGGS